MPAHAIDMHLPPSSHDVHLREKKMDRLILHLYRFPSVKLRSSES
jgi:hypothetical protein